MNDYEFIALVALLAAAGVWSLEWWADRRLQAEKERRRRGGK